MQSEWYYLFFGVFLLLAVLFLLRKRTLLGLILLMMGSIGIFYIYTTGDPNPFIVAMIMLACAVIIGFLSKITQPQSKFHTPISLKR